MGKTKNYTDAFKAKVIERAKELGKPKVVAKEFNISPGSVRNWLKRAKGPGEGRGRQAESRAPRAAMPARRSISQESQGSDEAFVDSVRRELQKTEKRAEMLSRLLGELTT